MWCGVRLASWCDALSVSLAGWCFCRLVVLDSLIVCYQMHVGDEDYTPFGMYTPSSSDEQTDLSYIIWDSYGPESNWQLLYCVHGRPRPQSHLVGPCAPVFICYGRAAWPTWQPMVDEKASAVLVDPPGVIRAVMRSGVCLIIGRNPSSSSYWWAAWRTVALLLA